MLRPAGHATIDGRRVDVVSRGEMIAEGVPVVVVEVEGNRVVVARAAESGS
jgi:membrane-bound serine protease (ClpP class)